MTPADLARLHGACFTTPRPWSATEFADLLAARGVFVIARPEGFIMGRVIADEAELLTLAVDPAARRQGIGAALLAAFEAHARAAGAVTAFLEVAAPNAAARALYACGGWAEAGCRRGYFRTPQGEAQDALILTRALS
ncbi:GNAT family N-acetyltransferase [Phaeovulum vinaykumarii]|uniref:Ribosomal-protein-alanine N-acetyltransferase n=1 Tax=Phaeovulum vinaykumarii TaxID=407234 RepID=A0A1N7M9P5_9RHOB|nr:GNAT family N-acetyltransferase [Phaeovulum vinaykumarii]SIS82814.1 ribosomal-protein-alanine N-acetyltransferase [Phaeovulum vinaykumarii]SOC10633.1 ribosomal-protein-alanine N-acetyltransferase [Phaeovulum vinaykumarii]